MPQRQGYMSRNWVPNPHCIQNICGELILSLSLSGSPWKTTRGQETMSVSPKGWARTRQTEAAAHFHTGAFGCEPAAVFLQLKSWGSCGCHSHWPPQREKPLTSVGLPEICSCSHAFKKRIKGFRAEVNLGNPLCEIFSFSWFPFLLNIMYHHARGSLVDCWPTVLSRLPLLPP